MKLALGLPFSAFETQLLFYTTKYTVRFVIFEVSSYRFAVSKVIGSLVLLFTWFTPIPQSILVAFLFAKFTLVF